MNSEPDPFREGSDNPMFREAVKAGDQCHLRRGIVVRIGFAAVEFNLVPALLQPGRKRCVIGKREQGRVDQRDAHQ